MEFDYAIRKDVIAPKNETEGEQPGRRERFSSLLAARDYINSGSHYDTWFLQFAEKDDRIIPQENNVKRAIKAVQKAKAQQLLQKKVLKTTQKHKWQTKMDQILASRANDRTIIVILDHEGGSGKSTYARSKYFENDEKTAVIQNGRTQDIAHAISKTNNNTLENIFIDLMRLNMEHVNYNLIERLKNGIVFSSKYDSTTVRLAAIPHVVIFTNVMIDIEKMSKDRWLVFETFECGPPMPGAKRDFDIRLIYAAGGPVTTIQGAHCPAFEVDKYLLTGNPLYQSYLPGGDIPVNVMAELTNADDDWFVGSDSDDEPLTLTPGETGDEAADNLSADMG